MNHIELEEFWSFWQFFLPPQLSRLQKTGHTKIDLNKKDLQLLIESGLFIPFEQPIGESKGLKMRIFAVPEKMVESSEGTITGRRRFIIHTIDINDQTDCPSTKFAEFESMISEGVRGYWWTNDASAYYHQFPLPPESQEFYAFDSPFGILTLASIPTGQRHCGGAAQCVSKFLLRKTTENETTSNPNRYVFTEAYIDNFRSIHETREEAIKSAEVFDDMAKKYNITMNETLESMISSIDKPKEFRGVLFDGQSVGITDKTKTKLKHCQRSLENASRWTFEEIDSVFGLLIFASTIVQIDLSQYFYVYKFMRRRHQQQNKFNLSRKLNAKIWPSIIGPNAGTLTRWIEELIPSQRRYPLLPTSGIPVLVTDASLLGWGAMLFLNHRVVWCGGQWEQEDFLGSNDPSGSHRCIAYLEALAVLKGLSNLCSDSPCIHVVIDNTAIIGSLLRRRSTSFHINKLIHQIARWRIASITYVLSESNPSDPISRNSLEQSDLQQEAFKSLIANNSRWTDFI